MERVVTFQTEQWKLDVNRIKTKEDMKLCIFVNFNETFLNTRYEYANEWVDDLIASQFYFYFCSNM